MTGNRYPLVSQRVRTQGQKPMAIEDAAWRSRAVALASTGMSRRGVAARMGVSHTTMYGYLERGRAEPDNEPWGSFATDYLMAERGLEQAASTTIALVVQRLHDMAVSGRWDELADNTQLKELLNVLAHRWPDDWGHSAHHRIPEPEPSGEAWLERTGMNRSQLIHMLRKPPEPIAEALVECADDVYALLLASGWQPKESK